MLRKRLMEIAEISARYTGQSTAIRVGHLQFNKIIDVARQSIKLRNFGNFSHRRRKRLIPFIGIFGCPYDEDRRAGAELLRVEQGHALLMMPLSSKLRNAPPTSVAGRVYLFGDFTNRAMRFLQKIQNLDVEFVEGCRQKCSLFWEIVGERTKTCHVVARIW